MRSKSFSDQAGNSSWPRTSEYQSSRLSLWTWPDRRVISLSTCAPKPAAIGYIAALIACIDFASEPPSVNMAAVNVARPFLPSGSKPAPACTRNATSTSGDDADGLVMNDTGVASDGFSTESTASSASTTSAFDASAIPAAATSSSTDDMPSIPGTDSSLDNVNVTRESSTKYLFAALRRSVAVSES